MAQILIVEDDAAINDLIEMNLSAAGHSCSQVRSGEDAVALLRQKEFDLLVLDINLPGMDGFEVFRYKGEAAAIFLTAVGDRKSKLKGLTIGAEDYIVKPFDILELMARVNIALRRAGRQDMVFRFAAVCVDLGTRIVTVRGKPVSLTQQEFELLATLLRNRNLAVTREQLLKDAWADKDIDDFRTVDVHISSLRKKLEIQKELVTVYKHGYRLEV